MAELTPRQWQTIERARQAMRDVIREAYPEDAPRLWATAIAGSFTELCGASLHPDELFAVINEQLRPLGREFRETRRH